MKKREFVIILAMIFVVAFFFFRSQKPKKSIDEDDSSNVEQIQTKAPSQNAPPVGETAPNATSVQVPTANSVLTATLSDSVLKRFAQHMQNFEKCLQISGLANVSDPTPDNLISALRPSLGDTVVQIDDWSQYDIIDKTGSKKRIRVDFDYPDGVTPNRRLSMYTINAYGGLEIDNLTNDQADNPNMAYIESLKEGTQVLSEERAARVYFTQGEELVFTIKNGHLDSISMSKGDKAMNCNNLSEENSRCACP